MGTTQYLTEAREAAGSSIYYWDITDKPFTKFQPAKILT